jgi:hypothetical protein
MKTILTIIIIVLFSINANSQLIIKESAKDSIVWRASKLTTVPKLIHFYGESDNYTMYYQNAKYSTITDIKYISIGDLKTTIQFFEALNDVITENKELNVTIKNETWLLKKVMKNVCIYSQFSFFYLSQKQVNSILKTIKQK